MRIVLNPDKKTWDGFRGFFAFIALCFIGIACWLIFHEKMLEHEAKILLLIPIGIFTICIALALFASDDFLQKVYRSLRILKIFQLFK